MSYTHTYTGKWSSIMTIKFRFILFARIHFSQFFQHFLVYFRLYWPDFNQISVSCLSNPQTVVFARIITSSTAYRLERKVFLKFEFVLTSPNFGISALKFLVDDLQNTHLICTHRSSIKTPKFVIFRKKNFSDCDTNESKSSLNFCRVRFHSH